MQRFPLVHWDFSPTLQSRVFWGEGAQGTHQGEETGVSCVVQAGILAKIKCIRWLSLNILKYGLKLHSFCFLGINPLQQFQQICAPLFILRSYPKMVKEAFQTCFSATGQQQPPSEPSFCFPPLFGVKWWEPDKDNYFISLTAQYLQSDEQGFKWQRNQSIEASTNQTAPKAHRSSCA